MKKLNLSFLMALAAVSSAVAQNYYFTSSYGGSNHDYAHAAQLLPDGYFVAGSTYSAGAGGRDIMISKTDFSGAIIWTKTLGGANDEWVNAMTPTSDGNFVLIGNSKSFTGTGLDSDNLLMMKVDTSGTVLWSEIYGGTLAEAGWSVEEAANGDLLVCGTTQSIGAGNEDMLLMRTSSSGTLKWFKAFGTTFREYALGLAELNDGSIVVTGSAHNAGSTTKHIVAVKTDSLGNLIWTKKYDFTGYFTTNYKRSGNDVVFAQDGSLVFTGILGSDFIGAAAPFLMKTDTAGSVTWAYFYTINSGFCGGRYLSELSSGDFIISGFMGNLNIPVMVGVDANGDESWSYYFSNSGTFSYRGSAGPVLVHPGEGLVLPVGLINATSSTDTSAALIKTNLIGMAACNYNVSFGAGTSPGNSQPVTVSALVFAAASGASQGTAALNTTVFAVTENFICSNVGVKEVVDEENDEWIYPNPATDKFTIDLRSVSEKTNSIRILNALGQCVYEEKQGFTKTKQLNVSAFAQGIYFVQLDGGDKLYTKKLIIQR